MDDDGQPGSGPRRDERHARLEASLELGTRQDECSRHVLARLNHQHSGFGLDGSVVCTHGAIM